MSILHQKLIEAFAPESMQHAADPVGWTEQKLGEELWSKQREISESVRDERYTAVQSCHGTGKSYIASRLVSWWLDTHPVGSAFAVTTAPTQRQVASILWRYIRGAHRKAELPGRTTLNCHWYMGSDELVAYGTKPKDYTNEEEAMAAFQGIHARYVLVVIDEACGIPSWLWKAVDTLVTNDDSRVLAIGNPDDPSSQFKKVCQPGSGWNNIKISYLDTPNFTGEKVSEQASAELIGVDWVEERKKRWGEQSASYTSKVLGEFPESSDDSLFSASLLRSACETDIPPIGPVKFGLDVARTGDDESAIYANKGGVVRLRFKSSKVTDTMELVGNAANMFIGQPKSSTQMAVDVIGVGGGVYDRLREQGYNVLAFNSSERAKNPRKFKNRRAEAYWAVRQMAEEGLINFDEADEDLLNQLGSIKWKVDSVGRIQIESKEDMAKRGIPSPDLADAVVMALEPNEMSAYAEPATRKAKTLTGDLLDAKM